MIISKIKKHKKAIIISVSILLLFLITIILVKIDQRRKYQKYIEEETARVKQYTSLEEFKSIEEVALYLDCKFEKQEKSERDNINYDIYMKLPIDVADGDLSHKAFLEKLIQYSAYALKYKNFVIIDKEHKTNITVICNEEQNEISTYYINDIENYFVTKQNEENIEKFTQVKEIELTATSNILQQLISFNWRSNAIQAGTAESTYKGYDIYFDEGYEIKKVDGKVFNIVFNEKYQENVINNFNVNSTLEEIKDSLGKPQFESGSLIGYKSKDFYVFFYNKQISIYRVDNYDTETFAELIEKYKNSTNTKEFVDEVKRNWTDYDSFEYRTNYIKVQYTLKGICIKYDSTEKQGIVVYNNYKGKILGNLTLEEVASTKQTLPNNIFIENKDLVFEAEKARVNTIEDTTSNGNYPTTVVLNTSRKFKTIKQTLPGTNDLYQIRFVSIGKELPNTELREVISRAIWYDDYNFVYAVKGRGIFMYNVQSQSYKTLTAGNGEYVIHNIDNGILYYDEESIELK